MYLGNQPALSYTSFAKQDFTTSATTSYTLDNPVTNANELALFINFVRQEPTTAYSASGTSLTLTSATSASDDMYCVYLGKAVQTVNPPNGSVGTAQLADDAVTKAKTSALMYPAFFAFLNSDQSSIADSTSTKINVNDEVFDTDNCYDNTTNYRFTPNVAGKYLFQAALILESTTDSNMVDMSGFIIKNGTNVAQSQTNPSTNYGRKFTQTLSVVLEANGTTDYFELWAYGDVGGGLTSTAKGVSGRYATYFGAFRIGD